MKGPVHSLAFFLIAIFSWKPVSAGTCWSSLTRGGFCQGFIKDGLTMTECCKMTLGQAAYIDKDITKSDKVFYYMFINPPLCRSCSQELPSSRPALISPKNPDPCDGIYCGKNRRCKLDAFLQPRCVCSPNCSKAYSGEVCASNSKTFVSECEVLKSRCREMEDFKVDYYHKCQATCDTVKCPAGKRCIVDQYKVPHCINMVCPQRCTNKGGEEMVCGTDGATYDSFCHLRKHACASGLPIGVAHNGKCEDATCRTYRCPKPKKCLTDKNKRIRCVVCKKFCFEGLYSYRPVCGSDGHTYQNWCMLRQASCDTGTFIDVAHKGNCRTGPNSSSPT